MCTNPCLSDPDHARSPEKCLPKLRALLGQLPRANYDTLKYLMAFLVLVAKREEWNKMSAMSLGIVFGPNLFR